MNKKLIIVDLYGVMSRGSYRTTCQYLAKKYNLDIEELYDIFYHKYFVAATLMKITERESLQKAIDHFGLNEDWKKLRAKHLSFQKLNRSVLKLCNSLQRRGYIIVLLSSNVPSQFNQCVRMWGLRKYFKYVFNTYELGMKKQSAKMLRYLLRRFKVKASETIMIDDQRFNLVEAKKMGVKTILYKNFKQMSGELKKVLKHRT